jgi:hypothetical protein
MAIRALSLRETDRFNAARATVAQHTAQAVEWFADDDGDVLGAITYQHRDLEWSVMVLRRDGRGAFSTLDHHSGLHVLDAARRLVLMKMTMALSSGRRVEAPAKRVAA